MASRVSPFLNPGLIAAADTLAIVHLKRDHQIPTILRPRDDDDEGYEEGKVVNTQFGSYPHTTLIGLQWGSQVRASRVDTGSRGRRIKGGDKRKREPSEAQETDQQEDTLAAGKVAVTASSGFIHVLAPTPENWTSSLPHRTQVVYTPDYSYILHRLRARPGTSIIEAGAGSGSFTHASARAIYSGYPLVEVDPSTRPLKKRKLGKVWSFEFHEQRHGKLVKEIQDHGLEGVVEITHRDVCRDGFLVGPNGDESPYAEAVFLDLPAPWLALPHLTRRPTSSKFGTPTLPTTPLSTSENGHFRSPLNPHCTVRICTFSPCIEQVQRTVSIMRRLGWVDISMEEVTQKRLEIRRERVGIENGTQRGVLPMAANVEEAVARLREVEGRFKAFHGQNDDDHVEARKCGENIMDDRKHLKSKSKENPNSRGKILESLVEQKVYKEGRLTHRTEPEVKTHTSYLVFAVLPQEWSPEEDERASANWPIKKKNSVTSAGDNVGLSRKQMKKAARKAQKERLDGKDREVTEGGALADGIELPDDAVENSGNVNTPL